VVLLRKFSLYGRSGARARRLQPHQPHGWSGPACHTAPVRRRGRGIIITLLLRYWKAKIIVTLITYKRYGGTLQSQSLPWWVYVSQAAVHQRTVASSLSLLFISLGCRPPEAVTRRTFFTCPASYPLFFVNSATKNIIRSGVTRSPRLEDVTRG